MRSALTLALSALAVQRAACAPVQARDEYQKNIVWHTVYEKVVKTVDIYSTVWVQPPPQHTVVEVTTVHGNLPAANTPAATTPAAQATTSAAPVNSYVAQKPPANNPPKAVAQTSYKPSPAPTPTPTPSPSVVPQQQHQSYAAAPQSSYVASPPSGSESSSGGQGKSFNGYSSGMLPGASHSYGCAGGCVGDMTFFNPSLGACGYKDGVSSLYTDEDDVVAVSGAMMGSLSSGDVMNPMCGRKIKITNPTSGKTATGTVSDKCPDCPGNEDIDLSPSLFDKLGLAGTGRYHGVHWSWE